ncbi:MAG: alpha/beta fold hydrolase [Gammaproteobacteria bacterium]|nr:alpha/beta fold hydrolase [Gammaproteobacteria bacterium]
MSATFPQQQITIATGRRIGYRAAGSGPALLILHGAGAGSTSFSYQLEALAQHYRVIAWDTPGYGGSDDSPYAAPSAYDYAADATALLDALGVEWAHIIGHSLGGLIATALVATAAARVDRIVLSSPAAGLARAGEKTRAARTAARIEDITTLGPAGMAQVRGPRMVAAEASAAVRQRATQIMARVRICGYCAAARLLARGDAFGSIEKWPIPPPPTLVLVGAEDATTPPPEVRRLAHCIAGSRYLEIASAAHAAYLEQPEAFTTAVREFLNA